MPIIELVAVAISGGLVGGWGGAKVGSALVETDEQEPDADDSIASQSQPRLDGAHPGASTGYDARQRPLLLKTTAPAVPGSSSSSLGPRLSTDQAPMPRPYADRTSMPRLSADQAPLPRQSVTERGQVLRARRPDVPGVHRSSQEYRSPPQTQQLSGSRALATVLPASGPDLATVLPGSRPDLTTEAGAIYAAAGFSSSTGSATALTAPEPTDLFLCGPSLVVPDDSECNLVIPNLSQQRSMGGKVQLLISDGSADSVILCADIYDQGHFGDGTRIHLMSRERNTIWGGCKDSGRSGSLHLFDSVNSKPPWGTVHLNQDGSCEMMTASGKRVTIQETSSGRFFTDGYGVTLGISKGRAGGRALRVGPLVDVGFVVLCHLAIDVLERPKLGRSQASIPL